MKRYSPAEVEPKWQKLWSQDGRYTAINDSSKQKFYVANMFPYPSAAGMHVGHAMGTAVTDAVARFQRSLGKNVLNPMGWDAFGLPAENYAIKTGQTPQKTTHDNIKNFTNQLKRMGASIDWSREVTTSDPEYYRWTQWVFSELFKKGLAYQKESLQWWCPKDQTVLANEQVVDGKCWRCGTDVVKKSMKQWFFRITEYADSLLDEIPDLDWPEKVKSAQTNWIGRSYGAAVDFSVESQVEPNFVILHGLSGGPDETWFPHTKKTLEDKGYQVQVPQLPHADNPSEDEQVKYVLDNCKIDKNTILVGHSLGGAVAMKVVQQLSFPIRKLMLIAPTVGPEFRDENYFTSSPRPFADTFSFDYNYERIKQNTLQRLIISDNAETDRFPYLQYLEGKIDALLLKTDAVSTHFTSRQEPFITDKIEDLLTVFTTRPDTLFGATFMVLAPEHPMIPYLVNSETKELVDQYIADSVKKSEVERSNADKEKTGVFTGSHAVNPVNGDKIPIWVADYVLWGYGTGAVMSVPAHDERDYDFARKFDLPIVQVIERPNDDTGEGMAYGGDGTIVNSGRFSGRQSSEVREEIMSWLKYDGSGRSQVSYKMRDWLISRQRYWGAPIPIIHCPEHGAVSVPDSELPVVLPEIADFQPHGDGLSPLARQTDWVNTTCPICGGAAQRETDVMDGYACSSWYLLRYMDPRNSQEAWSPEIADYWSPIDMYIGGDHAVAHLLYVRFWSHVFYAMGLVPTKEPISKLVYHGLIHAEDGRKMSKSLGNVVDPLEVIDAGYGADALRTFELFVGPVNEDSQWSSTGIAGVYRFLNRVWTLVQEFLEAETAGISGDSQSSEDVVIAQHKVTKRVTDEYRRLSFNTAIAALMEYVNELYKYKKHGFTAKWRPAIEVLLQLVSPTAPHLAAELWQQMGRGDALDFEPWPTWDESVLTDDKMTIGVQVNGKMRGEITVPKDIAPDVVKAEARQEKNVARHIEGHKIVKEIYVPGRLISIVIA